MVCKYLATVPLPPASSTPFQAGVVSDLESFLSHYLLEVIKSRAIEEHRYYTRLRSVIPRTQARAGGNPARARLVRQKENLIRQSLEIVSNLVQSIDHSIARLPARHIAIAREAEVVDEAFRHNSVVAQLCLNQDLSKQPVPAGLGWLQQVYLQWRQRMNEEIQKYATYVDKDDPLVIDFHIGSLQLLQIPTLDLDR